MSKANLIYFIFLILSFKESKNIYAQKINQVIYNINDYDDSLLNYSPIYNSINEIPKQSKIKINLNINERQENLLLKVNLKSKKRALFKQRIPFDGICFSITIECNSTDTLIVSTKNYIHTIVLSEYLHNSFIYSKNSLINCYGYQNNNNDKIYYFTFNELEFLENRY